MSIGASCAMNRDNSMKIFFLYNLKSFCDEEIHILRKIIVLLVLNEGS